MKTLIRSNAVLQNPIRLLLFCALAFLPAILHLAWRDFPITNPFAALGPVAAGFWFAATIWEIRVNFTFLGVLMAALLWFVNWLMMAGGDCCATLGGH